MLRINYFDLLAIGNNFFKYYLRYDTIQDENSPYFLFMSALKDPRRVPGMYPLSSKFFWFSCSFQENFTTLGEFYRIGTPKFCANKTNWIACLQFSDLVSRVGEQLGYKLIRINLFRIDLFAQATYRFDRQKIKERHFVGSIWSCVNLSPKRSNLTSYELSFTKIIVFTRLNQTFETQKLNNILLMFNLILHLA